MMALIESVNSELESQSSYSAIARSLPLPKPQTGLTSTSLGISSNFWDEDADEYQIAPSATLSFTFSFADPSWPSNSLTLREAQARADQEESNIRSRLTQELFNALEELSDISSERRRLISVSQQLTARLDRISNERVVVSLEQVWELEERLLALDASIGSIDQEAQLLLTRTAMELGESRWKELLDLLREWSRQTLRQ
jgi:hypothetical protein